MQRERNDLLQSLKETYPREFERLESSQWYNESFLSLLSDNELKEILERHNIDVNIEEPKSKTPRTVFNIPERDWKISTGSTQIDHLLDNDAITPGNIFLFYGRFRSGKTQICKHVTVNALKKFSNHGPVKELVLYIDTEGTFRPDRIQKIILDGKNISTNRISDNELPPDYYLRMISVYQPTIQSQMSLFLQNLSQIMADYSYKIIIIDSLTNFYREELGRNPNPGETIQTLIRDLQQLQKISKTHDVAIVCTSQVTATMGSHHFFNIQPILALILNMFIKQWVLLGEDEQLPDSDENRGRRFARLVNGLKKPSNIAQFRIVDKGIEDFFV